MSNTDTLEQAREDGRVPWYDGNQHHPSVVIYKDKYPVTEGHLLFVPKVNDSYHIRECFKLAIALGKGKVLGDNDVTGYNVGLNMGESAGQTVMYPHVHLIYRRDNDVEFPQGGVRGVIPCKQQY
mgnify:CR=1 FL=1